MMLQAVPIASAGCRRIRSVSEAGWRASLTLRVHRGPRRGLTLLEVLLSLTIFLFAMVAIGRLITLGSDRALDVKGREAQLCQSKLAEVSAGVLQLSVGSSQSGTFDEEPGWNWTVNVQDSGIPALWNVKVTVSHKRSDGTQSEAILTQMVLDPSQRGSTLDPVPTPQTSSTQDTSGSSSSNSQNSGSQNSGMQDASMGKAMTPKTATPTPSVAPKTTTTPTPTPSVAPKTTTTPATNSSSTPAKGGKS
jgi:hypothetical protein